MDEKHEKQEGLSTFEKYLYIWIANLYIFFDSIKSLGFFFYFYTPDRMHSGSSRMDHPDPQ